MQSAAARAHTRSTEGSSMKITYATPSALRSRLASASRIATARCEGTWSTTSSTPVATTVTAQAIHGTAPWAVILTGQTGSGKAR
jgi:hypothetical protein